MEQLKLNILSSARKSHFTKMNLNEKNSSVNFSNNQAQAQAQAQNNQSINQIISTFNNSKIKKIVNTYQKSKLKNSPTTPGLGDYLRGCFFTLQVSMILGLQFDMNLKNHPLSLYLNTSTEQEQANINTGELCRYEDMNYDGPGKVHSKKCIINFISHLNSLGSNIDSQGNYYFFSNSFPIFNKISNIERQIIRSKMEPNEMMKNNIELNLQSLGINKKQYQVIHIRCGDTYIKDTHMNDSTYKIENGISINNNQYFLNKVNNILTKYINPSNKYVILSDNNEIKSFIKSKFPNTIIQLNKIVHLGQSTNLQNDGIMQTLLDFYIIGLSTNVLALSRYDHGTGFSRWSSVIYNVPYTNIHIQV